MHISSKEKLLLKLDIGLALGFLGILVWDGILLFSKAPIPSWVAWLPLAFIFLAGFYGLIRGGPQSSS